MKTNIDNKHDGRIEGLTDSQSLDQGHLSAPIRERDASNSIVAGEVAKEAGEKVLADEAVTAREIRIQSAYPGNELDVGQQAAHAERARAETETDE